MTGVMPEPEWALRYGSNMAAIERALGRRVTVWRETTSADDEPGEAPEHLRPHVLETPVSHLDPRVIPGFSIHVDPEETGD